MIDDLTSRLDEAGVAELPQIIGSLRSNRAHQKPPPA